MSLPLRPALIAVCLSCGTWLSATASAQVLTPTTAGPFLGVTSYYDTSYPAAYASYFGFYYPPYAGSVFLPARVSPVVTTPVVAGPTVAPVTSTSVYYYGYPYSFAYPYGATATASTVSVGTVSYGGAPVSFSAGAIGYSYGGWPYSGYAPGYYFPGYHGPTWFGYAW